MYSVYLFSILLPQLRRLNWLQDVSKPTLLTNDPHMHPASVGEVVGLAVSFHIVFILFLSSFMQAMTTNPGSIPQGDERVRSRRDGENVCLHVHVFPLYVPFSHTRSFFSLSRSGSKENSTSCLQKTRR